MNQIKRLPYPPLPTHSWNNPNREIIENNNKDRRKKNEQNRRRFINSFKKECRNCGEREYKKLTFHHLGRKLFDLGSSDALKFNLVILRREISKCEILCKKCHREEELRLEDMK